jgi:DNA-binding winged helix-turn-helix (wHTH) protein/tetratricopeptide (TPR) repeat protein
MMPFRFDQFELDAEKFELRRNGAAVAIEPQVLSVLLFLVKNRERLVTKDELIEEVWRGRIVSDSALASRIKTARRLLNDDGRQQRVIRTIHGKGFRFVGPLEEAALKPHAGVEASPDGLQEPISTRGRPRPSIAVLPFSLVGAPDRYGVIAEALPHELIAELSRLRWLLVIARGSSFQFRSADPDISRVGAVLGVDYCLSGTVEIIAAKIMLSVELADTRDRAIIWTERYACDVGDIHDVRGRIVANTVAALELHIPLHEAQSARLRSPEDLEAWSTYHLGLQHMFRFTKGDNAAAIKMFEQAVAKEPGFARAYAGLSFSHFQDAFLNYSANVGGEAIAARRFAERAVELDALDPFANFTMGRSHWLTGNVESSLGWLERAIALNPNYAQGIYARAWAETILCHGANGQTHVDEALLLSPIDPLRYAMLGTRALSHLVEGEYVQAASWGDAAARAPGAHVLIAVIAIACHSLNDDLAKARAWAENVWDRRPDFAQRDFFRSFPFADPGMRERIGRGLARIGIG